MKKITMATLFILFFTFCLFSQTEDEKNREFLEIAIKYAKQVNQGTESESLEPLKAKDEIKLERIAADYNNTVYYIDWMVQDKLKTDELDLYLVRYQRATFYIAVSTELGIKLNPNYSLLYYGDRCRLIYVDNNGEYIDTDGIHHKACRFVFAKGW